MHAGIFGAGVSGKGPSFGRLLMGVIHFASPVHPNRLASISYCFTLEVGPSLTGEPPCLGASHLTFHVFARRRSAAVPVRADQTYCL